MLWVEQPGEFGDWGVVVGVACCVERGCSGGVGNVVDHGADGGVGVELD